MNKAERTRQFIIEKSANIINRKGMAGTSLSDIMEATKLAKGGIYGNFESKDEIYIESFTYLWESIASELDKVIMKGNTAKEKFFNFLDHYNLKSNNTMSMEGGCPMLNFGTESDDTHPLMKENVKKAIREMQRKIFNVISDGVANNELSSAINPKEFSIKVFALIEGGILLRKVLESNSQMNIIIENIKKEFEDYLM